MDRGKALSMAVTHARVDAPGAAMGLLRSLAARAGRAAGITAWFACLPPTAAAAPAPPARTAKAYEPTIRLLTQDGQSVHFYDDLIKGRIALVNTMFTSCQAICPPITANLVKVQKGLSRYLGKQVIMVSITVDPEGDTPQILKRYADRFGVGPGWIFLTGKRTDVDSVLAKIGDGDPDKNRHSGMLLLGDDAARSWRKLFAMTDPNEIVAAVEKLLAQRKSSASTAVVAPQK